MLFDQFAVHVSVLLRWRCVGTASSDHDSGPTLSPRTSRVYESRAASLEIFTVQHHLPQVKSTLDIKPVLMNCSPHVRYLVLYWHGAVQKTV